MVIPELHIIRKVEGCICYLSVFRCPLHTEIPLTAVQPGKQVAHTIEFWKVHLVRCGECLILFIIVTQTSTAVGRRPTATWRADITLHVEVAHAQHPLLLSCSTSVASSTVTGSFRGTSGLIISLNRLKSAQHLSHGDILVLLFLP
jgi:hypothetical protein